LAKAPGYRGSELGNLTEWVGPLVGFLVPAFAFVVSIPRSFRVPRMESWFGLKKRYSLPWLVFSLVIMILDIVLWIIIVFAFSGPLIAGAIHEALIDHTVLDAVRETVEGALQQPLPPQLREEGRQDIAFALVGSLMPGDGELAAKIQSDIVSSAHGRRKLQALLTLLPSYGTRVGVPVFFYLGAYAYSLIDAENRRGDNDTAHAIAFGLWYGVIVIGAIVSSSVLGIDNPASLEAVFSESNPPITGFSQPWHFYESPFRTVWVWNRARLFQSWTHWAPLDPAICTKILSFRCRFWAAFSAALLITIPCSFAFTVSYFTPEIGIGCRSLTILVFVCSQNGLLIWWLYHNSSLRLQHKNKNIPWYKTKSFILVHLWAGLCLILGAFSTVGGTIMQLVGVYRNCICKAGIIQYAIHNENSTVRLSTDNQDHRDSWIFWNIFGITGIAFIGVLSLFGWLYQARTRARCRKLIEKL
ncbi:uncharacterized protein BDR25DRAFT_369425, partial [Lindgomyces ingoldianus]